MRRRRRADSGIGGLGSESLIDVLSNMVGGLALLCIMAALDAGNLRRPLLISQERAADTKGLTLVVSNDSVRVFDAEKMAERIRKEVDLLADPGSPRHLTPTPEIPFDIHLTASRDGSRGISIEASDAYPADSVDDLLAGRGEVAGRLKALDPAKSHVFVRLAPDSFDRYLALRGYCHELGLNVGWKPQEGPIDELTWGQRSGGGGGGIDGDIQIK